MLLVVRLHGRTPSTAPPRAKTARREVLDAGDEVGRVNTYAQWVILRTETSRNLYLAPLLDILGDSQKWLGLPQ